MGNTILIVDDELTQLALLSSLLRDRMGYNVVALSNGEKAVDYLVSRQEPRPDLLLLDLIMPESNGLDLIRIMRPLKAQLPIICLTQGGNHEIAQQALKAGAFDFIAKPVEPERLVVCIQNALKFNQLQLELERLRRSESREIHNGYAGAQQGLKQVMSYASQENAYSDALHIPDNLPLLSPEKQVYTIEYMEEQMIRFALKYYQGHISEVARRLGIGRSTLYRKMNEFRIQESNWAAA